MKTLLNKITNVDFIFNAVKFTFLTIIVVGLVCVSYQVAFHPESLTIAGS